MTGNHISIILLAAGSSERLGRPKQLLPYRGKSLIQFVTGELLLAGAQRVTVVLGAFSALIQKELDQEKILVADNPFWKEGIASSIRAGLESALEADPQCEAAIFAVCDQPHISAGLLKELAGKHQSTGKPIVASAYMNTLGTPAFFHRSLFPELKKLRGDAGAKKMIQLHPESVAAVPFPKGYIDVDTPGDYEATLC